MDTDQYSLPTNPVESTVLPSRKTGIRNEVTPPALSASRTRGAGANRRRRGGGMVQEAKAGGKAAGYADVDPTIWKVAASVGVQTS